MTDYQKTVIALVSSFNVTFKVVTESYWFMEKPKIWIYLDRTNSPETEYRKCRRALRLNYGLKRLWDNQNFYIGDKSENMFLWEYK